jgi:exodeoxyribonuclease V alpha subunit
MYGMYYKTVKQNQNTGVTRFMFAPKEPCEYVQDGLLLCEGKIAFYAEKMPMCIEGEYQDGVFYVEKDFIPYDTKEAIIDLLGHITKDLTEKQKEDIATLTAGKLFNVIGKASFWCDLEEALKRSKKQKVLIKKIILGLKRLKESEELAKELMKYQIPIDKIEALCKRDVSLAVIDKNPYTFFLKFGIPVQTADLYAQNRLHLGEYALPRLTGFVYAAMEWILSSGHTCAQLSQLTTATNRMLKKNGLYENTVVDEPIVNLCIQEMDEIFSYHTIDGIPYVYHNHVWEEESASIAHVKRLKLYKREFQHSVGVDVVEQNLGIRYNNGQRNAFKALNTSGIKILTGPPGSGKTAVINGLIESFRLNKGGKVTLAATTGMAAKVMARACHNPASTVNVMLNVRPFDDNDTIKGRNLNDPVDADLVIVDEVSMLGMQLFSVLAQSIKSGSILLLVGDEKQLQSVEYGNVLHDLAESGLIETYRLTEIIRQSGTICENAARVNRGVSNMQTDSHFYLYRCQTPSEVERLLQSNYDKSKDQILCPVKNGELSTSYLNNLFQDKSTQLMAMCGKREYWLGNKVIMTKTNYDVGYINGDIGYVVGSQGDSVQVQFANKTLYLDREDMHNMDLAEAITIHKSQGSEFEDVHIILPERAKNMMTRRIVYTAITRAKQRVFIYDIADCFRDAVGDRRETKRVTLFNTRLKQELSKI